MFAYGGYCLLLFYLLFGGLMVVSCCRFCFVILVSLGYLFWCFILLLFCLFGV